MRSVSCSPIFILVGLALPRTLMAQAVAKPERPKDCRVVPLGWNAMGQFAYLRDLDGQLCPSIPGFKSNWDHCLPEGIRNNESIEKAWLALGWEKEFTRNGFALASQLHCAMQLDLHKVKVEFELLRSEKRSGTAPVFAKAHGKHTQPLGTVSSDLEWVDAVLWSDKDDRVLVFWGNQFGTWEYIEFKKTKLRVFFFKNPAH